MDADIAGRISDWPSRSIEEAHEGLGRLADADFSGALNVGDAWVFVLDGQVVGIDGGTMDGIADTAGTAYQAPGEALPLLFAMQSTSDAEQRAQYYTEETSLDDVDETLSTGGFTGYIELSENVLSGDYYVVYHGGRSRAVAVVGTREEVILGDEAYQLAADEVGIYDVIEAPISVTEIPSVAEESGSIAGATSTSGDREEEVSSGEHSDDVEPTGNEVPSTEDTRATADSPDNSDRIEPSSVKDSSVQPDRTASGSVESEKATDTSPPVSSEDDSPTESSRETDDPSPPKEQTDDPGLSEPDAERPEEDAAEDRQGQSGASADDDRAARLSELQAELQQRTAERDRLRDRIDELESGVDGTEGSVDELDRTDRPWAETVPETSLFVRYESRSETTLEDMGEGVEKESLSSNLILDYHTNFDDTTVSIDGEPFESALRSSSQWAFFSWIVRDLPFEIRDTGRAGELPEVYDALPRIDRVELEGSVGGGTSESESPVEYDLICRDKTGNPLIVADIHEGRDPVDGPAVEDLMERTSGVISETDSIAAAFAVSPSFFRPEALEIAQSATASGMLSRDARLSYVKVDRNAGYHLWLVEARKGVYHVTIPEL